MRLDKCVADSTVFSRSEAKKLTRQGRVTINGKAVKKASIHALEGDVVAVDNKVLNIRKYLYVMLNKPVGYVCSTSGRDSILLLLPEKLIKRKPAAAGRLDKDVTGLVLLTDDGAWSHNITAPSRNKEKFYAATLDRKLTKEECERLEEGITLKGETKPTLPARLVHKEGTAYELVITEGRYHQVKRMFAAVGCRVVTLHRAQIGPIRLDSELCSGEWRFLTEAEIALIN